MLFSSVSGFNLMKRIFRYICGITSHGICFSIHSNFTFKAYNDSDWYGCLGTSRCIVFFLCIRRLKYYLLGSSDTSNHFSEFHKSNVQNRTLSDTAAEITWLTNMFGWHLCSSDSLELCCNNLLTLYLFADLALHK